jgi:hypothetical protein
MMWCPEPGVIHRGVVIAFLLSVASCVSGHPLASETDPRSPSLGVDAIPQPCTGFSYAPIWPLGMSSYALCCETRSAQIVEVVGTVGCRAAFGSTRPITRFEIRGFGRAGQCGYQALAERLYHDSEGRFAFAAVLLSCEGVTRDVRGNPIRCSWVTPASFLVRSPGCRDSKFIVDDETHEFTITMDCPGSCGDTSAFTG